MPKEAETLQESAISRSGSVRLMLAAILMAAVFSVALAAVIVNIALPQISIDLGARQVTAHWLTTGYAAAGTLTMLLSPLCARAFGIKQVLYLATVIFIAAAVSCANVNSLWALISARMIQGAASGFVITLAFIVMAEAYPLNLRGRAISIIGFGMVLAPTLGPPIGGIMIDMFGWRALMYLPVPFIALLLVFGFKILPNLRPSNSNEAFDLLGFSLLAAMIFGLLASLTFLQTHGWPKTDSVMLFAGLTVILVALIVREIKFSNPIINFRLFFFTGFGSASIVAFVFGLAVWGAAYLLPIFLQTARGFSASETGWIMLPGGVVMMIMMPVAGHLSDSSPPQRLIVSGLLCFAVSFIFLSYTGALSVWAGVYVITFLVTAGRGVGLGIIIPALDSAASRALPSEMLPEGLAMINFLRQLGGTLSPGLVALIFESRLSASASLTTEGGLGLSPIVAAYDQTLMLVGGVFLLALIPAWRMRHIS